MRNRLLLLLLPWLGTLPVGAADVLQLKDQAAVTGQILAEKRDQVAIDIGFTVLVVPKTQIISIKKGAAPSEKENLSASPTIVHAAEPKSIESATVPPVKVTPGPANVNKIQPSLYDSPASTRPERSVRELVSVLGEGVVQVRTPGGLGSGFILSEDGFLITNFHVIESETQISVEVYHQKAGQLERKSYKNVSIVAMNKFEDLALLKIEDKDAPKFSRVALGDADAMSVGERVFAIGSPLGLERTVTEGILSTKTRQIQGQLYLQTTAQINPGNSGGPLFNLRGEVIGVTSMKLTFGEGLGFAIPVEAVKFFLNHRDAYAYDNDNPSSPYRYLEPPSRLRKGSSAE